MPPFQNEDETLNIDNPLEQTDQAPDERSAAQNEISPVPEEDCAIPVPPPAEPFYNLVAPIAYFGFSQRGQSHIESDTPCQDRCFSAYLPDNGILIAAIADGVGSCALSDLGADTAVHASVEFIQKELQKTGGGELTAALAGSILRGALQSAYDQVALAAQAQEQLLYSLQSTLTVAIYNGTDLYFGHAGDDGIVVLTQEGTLAMATTRHKGPEASSVYPLQSKATWQFGMVPHAAAFVMATDGVLDAFVRGSFEKDRVYYPFLEPIFTTDYQSEGDVKQICGELFAYMSGETYRSAVRDDLTIVSVMNLEKLPHCLPKFDGEAWNEETRQYEQKIRSALYDKQQKSPRRQREDADHPSPPDQAASGAPAQPASPPRNPVPDPDSPRRSSQREFHNPYSKQKDDPGKPGAYRPDGDEDEKSCANHSQTPHQPPTAPPVDDWDGWKGSKRAKPKKHRKIRPQFFVFWTVVALILILLAFLGVRIVRFLMAFFWMFR